MNIKVLVSKTGNTITGGVNNFGTLCSNSYLGFKGWISNYFNSKEYEEDLDSIIEALHVHAQKRPSLEFSSDFKKRVLQKKKFLAEQAGKFVFAGTLTGAWAAIESGNFGMIGEYTLVGAGGAILIVVVTASSVIIKRMAGSSKSEFSKTSQAVEIFSHSFKG